MNDCTQVAMNDCTRVATNDCTRVATHAIQIHERLNLLAVGFTLNLLAVGLMMYFASRMIADVRSLLADLRMISISNTRSHGCVMDLQVFQKHFPTFA